MEVVDFEESSAFLGWYLRESVCLSVAIEKAKMSKL